MALIIASTSIYTILGGVRSSSYIEFLQTLIMVAGLIFAVPILLYYSGGPFVAWNYLSELDPRLTGSFTTGRN